MAGCGGCVHLDYIEDSDSDGHVNWNNSGFMCNARNGVQNLKSFPFTKKEMECFEKPEAKSIIKEAQESARKIEGIYVRKKEN